LRSKLFVFGAAFCKKVLAGKDVRGRDKKKFLEKLEL